MALVTTVMVYNALSYYTPKYSEMCFVCGSDDLEWEVRAALSKYTPKINTQKYAVCVFPHMMHTSPMSTFQKQLNCFFLMLFLFEHDRTPSGKKKW